MLCPSHDKYLSVSLLIRSRDYALQPTIRSADELHDSRVAGPHSHLPHVAVLEDMRGGYSDHRAPLLDVRRSADTPSSLYNAHRSTLPLPGLPALLPGAARELTGLCPASLIPGSAVRERGAQDEGQRSHRRLLHQAALLRADTHPHLSTRQRR